MKKKFKFHCLDDDSESPTESSESERTSDDDTPEINVPGQILNSNKFNQTKFLSDDETSLTPPPPPLPSSSSSSSSQSPKINKQQSNENDDSEASPIQSIDSNEESQPPPSLPDDIFLNGDEDPPPPEVEEVENVNDFIDNDNIKSNDDDDDNEENELHEKKTQKNKIPKSLKRKNKLMTREKELILNTNRIYDYFDHRISKLAILKAIHAKCGNYRLAIPALAQNPSQFDSVSLFESPKADTETLKKYLQL